MREINPSNEEPLRGQGEQDFEIIEFSEGTIVLRGLKSGRTYGVGLSNPGTDQEEMSVTELEAVPPAPERDLGPLAHHPV